MGVPCVFFDRDGVVNVVPDPERYVTSVGGFRVIPAFVESLRVVTERGYEAVVVTNQRGVSMGEVSKEELGRIHGRLGDILSAEGLGLLDILVCEEGDDGHPWRKPNPGMILEAARRHGLDLGRSWMIGDSERDIEAGQRAGCRAIRVGGVGEETRADVHLPAMEDLPGYLARELEWVGGSSA